MLVMKVKKIMFILEENNQKSFIKPQNYENTKSKKFKNNIGKRENMIYNKIADTYTCANNKELKFNYEKIKIWIYFES